MGKNKISFIIVNYNGLADSLQLLQSLYTFIKAPFEAIIVDNGSKVDETLPIKAAFPQAITIRSDINKGFAGGNNIGINAASADYLFFINNDTFIDTDITDTLIAVLDSDPSIGGVSPKIKTPGTGLIQFFGYSPLNPITLRNSTRGWMCPDSPRFQGTADTPFLHGAAMLIKREVIENVGPMSEIFFLYYEELDWSKRITDAGYKLKVCGEAYIYHKESQSVGKNSPLKAFYISRNRLLYGWRHSHGIDKTLMILYHLTIVYLKDSLHAALSRQWPLICPISRGILDFIRLKDKSNMLC